MHENYFEGLSYHYLKDRDPENLLEVDGLGSHAQKFEEISVGVEQEILVPNFHFCNVGGLEDLGGIQLFVPAHLHTYVDNVFSIIFRYFVVFLVFLFGELILKI